MAKKSDVTNLISSVPLFAEFSKRDLRKLGDVLREEWFSAGQDIIREGDAGARFYVIAEGRAKIITKGRARRTLGPGGFFGEMSLIDGSPRTATVRAETQVKALSLSRVAFRSLLEENWSMTQRVLADLCARIRSLDTSPTN